MSIATRPPVDTAPAPAPSPTSSRRRGPAARKAAAYTLLVLVAAVFIYPFLIQLATSFKTDPDAAAHPLSLVPQPVRPLRVEAHLRADRRRVGADAQTWLSNSVLVTVDVTVARVFLDSLAGYALSRLQFRGRGFLFGAVLAVMAVPGVALLIPKFLIVTYLGIFDTYTAMILPLIVDAAGVFIMKQFFDSVPISIEEAARMDGASVVPDVLVGGAADGPARAASP